MKTALFTGYFILLWIVGSLFHLFTTLMAYRVSGFVSTLMTFSFPPFAEIYWFVICWHHLGFINFYTVLFATVVLMGLLGMAFGTKMEEA